MTATDTAADPSPPTRLGKALAAVALSVALLAVLYYATATYLLRYRLDALIFPVSKTTSRALAPPAVRIVDPSGAELLLHRYGQIRVGCAVFFPGQHGELLDYQATLFHRLADAGVAVFAATYPGQNGAAGPATLQGLPGLAHHAVQAILHDCAPLRTIVLGRSLGSVVAAYAAARATPAGIVLDSTSPALSSAIIARIRSRWFLKPLALLPVSAILRQDYSLAQALAGSANIPVVVFQGTADELTPIVDLRGVHLPANVRLVPVAGASHATALAFALDAYVEVVLHLVGGQPAGEGLQGTHSAAN